MLHREFRHKYFTLFWNFISGLAESGLKGPNSRLNSLIIGNLWVETGSYLTAHTTTHSRVQRDFPANGERPRIGGACCRRLVSANEQLDLRGRFGASVSGSLNPVSWRRRPLSAETRFESRATAREVRAPDAA